MQSGTLPEAQSLLFAPLKNSGHKPVLGRDSDVRPTCKQASSESQRAGRASAPAQVPRLSNLHPFCSQRWKPTGLEHCLGDDRLLDASGLLTSVSSSFCLFDFPGPDCQGSTLPRHPAIGGAKDLLAFLVKLVKQHERAAPGISWQLSAWLGALPSCPSHPVSWRSHGN